MTCYLTLAPQQTPAQRKAQVARSISAIEKAIADRRVQIKVGRQGAITFSGISEDDRAGLADACIYNTLVRTGSRAAQLAIQQAERVAGRSVDRSVVAAGVHSHDGGRTWSQH